MVRPAMITLKDVAAHFSVSSLFEEYPQRARVFCYDVTQEDRRALCAGTARLVCGKADVVSAITRESQRFTYGVLHLGEHQISGGIRAFISDEAYEQTASEITEIFRSGDFAEIVRAVDRNFDSGTYSLKLLFRDEQRRIVDLILKSRMDRAEASYRHIYESDAMLMYFVKSLGMPVPSRLRLTAEYIMNTDLRRAFACAQLDLPMIRSILDEAKRLELTLDSATLEFALRGSIEKVAFEFGANPTDPDAIAQLWRAVNLARSLPFEVQLWNAQNVYYEVLGRLHPQMQEYASAGQPSAVRWIREFSRLGSDLMFAPMA